MIEYALGLLWRNSQGKLSTHLEQKGVRADAEVETLRYEHADTEK